MRRSTANVEAIAEMQLAFARAVERLSIDELERRIEVLTPFATDARKARLDAVLGSRIGSLTILLDSLHDPFNGAAVVRSCDVFGLPRLHVVERSESFLAARSVSRGSEQWVDIVTHRTGVVAAEHLVAAGFELVAAHPEGTLQPAELGSERGRVALVLGNERDGISVDVRERCNRTVKIPMRGFAESLNVSVTTAILLYELTKDRPGDLSRVERAQLYLRGLLQTIPKAQEILDASMLAV
ncbi:MAG: RNA methyltransferase [Polyangiaceae bacterium]|nr:RNA methyltransferase [Polyangiaceae bacterium]